MALRPSKDAVGEGRFDTPRQRPLENETKQSFSPPASLADQIFYGRRRRSVRERVQGGRPAGVANRELKSEVGIFDDGVPEVPADLVFDIGPDNHVLAVQARERSKTESV